MFRPTCITSNTAKRENEPYLGEPDASSFCNRMSMCRFELLAGASLFTTLQQESSFLSTLLAGSSLREDQVETEGPGIQS